MPFKSLDHAVRNLGRYFGILSKDAFVQKLIDIGAESEANIDQLINISSPGYVANLVMDVTEGGQSASQIIQATNLATLFGAEIEEQKELEEAVLVTFEPGIEWGNVCVNRGNHSAGTMSLNSGRPQAGEEPFSIRTLLGESDGQGVNLNPMGPTKSQPGLAVFQIFPSFLNFSARDSNAVAIFMNSIPTHELNRCTPYLDVRFVQSMTPTDSNGAAQSTSLFRFLNGRDIPLPNTANDAMLGGAMSWKINQAINAEGAMSEEQIAETIAKADALKAQAGMELFLSPATLVPANDLYDAHEVESAASGAPPTRSAGLIDKFRPFMSLTAFKLKVLPTRGVMSYKTGELNIVLHDRSRLGEIATLVKPDAAGKNEFLITYGWSHPDASADNAFGAFLNSLKVTEKYSAYSSSYNFDEVGQVNIKLKLSMKAARMVDITTISGNSELADRAATVRELFRAVNRLKREVMNDYGIEDIDEDGVVDTPDDLSDATVIDSATARSIANYVESMDGETSELRDALVALYGEDGEGGAAASLGQGIAAALSSKKSKLAIAYDPFFREAKAPGRSEPNITSMPYNVSFGKIMTLFFGQPLAATGLYDEVHLIFYCFNDQAGFMRNHNISQFPITRSTFTSLLDSDFQDRGKVSLRDFWRFVTSRFVNNMASRAYGFTAKLERDEETGASTPKNRVTASSLNSYIRQQMDAAYGAAGGADTPSRDFKRPRIDMCIEVVPYEPGGNQACVDAKKGSVCRVHIYDKQATSYSGMGKVLRSARGLMNTNVTPDIVISPVQTGLQAQSDPPAGGAAEQRSAKHGVVEAKLMEEGGVLQQMVETVPGYGPNSPSFARIKGGFPAIKKFLKSQMPSMTYGSMNTGILSAKLASQGNSRLATIQMLRSQESNNEESQGGSTGLPLRISPMQLSIDTLGCPILNYMQQFFIDFGTGTTADNIYVVTGMDHKITPGEFKTSAKLTYYDAYGTYSAMVDQVEQALASAEQED